MAKSNDMAIAYLSELCGEVRKSATKKYRKGSGPPDGGKSMTTVEGGFGDESGGHEAAELEALMSELEDDSYEESSKKRKFT